MEFLERVDAELNKLGWSRNELATRAGISNSYFSMLAKGSRNVGPDAAKKIGKALGVGADEVLRWAGIVETKSKLPVFTEQIIEIMQELDDRDREDLLDTAKAKLARKERTTGNPGRT